MMRNYISILIGCLLFIASCDRLEKEKLNVEMKHQINPTKHESQIGIDTTNLSTGQLLFVATYSGVQWTKDITELVGSNLSVRNTSTTEPITILYVDFYDDGGKLYENFIESEIDIAPMASRIFHIHQFDEKGGAGSNFLVEWKSETPVSPPYVENISFRMSGAQSFAFSSPSVVLKDKVNCR